MAWVTGTATDYHDLLNQMVQVATSQSISSVDSIANGGTGYSVDDVIDLVGGTSTHVGKLRVTGETAGVIDSVVIEEGGAYTSVPGDPVAVTGPGNDDATFNLTFANTGWTLQRYTQEALSATVTNGGTGYTVGDNITLDTEDALGEGTAAVFNVDTAPGGVIGTVSLVTAGDYEEVHSAPANIGVTGGTGNDDALLNVTFQNATSQDGVVILEGSGAGSDQIYVGVRTYNVLAENGFDQTYCWACNGMTGFNAALLYNNQPNISPGEDPVANSGSGGGAFVPLSDDIPAEVLTFWFSIDSRRIIVICRVEEGLSQIYSSCYMGLLNPFGTANEFPYPIYVAGSSARYNTYFADTEVRITGLTEAIGNTTFPGPAWYLRVDTVWQECENSQATDTGSQSRSVRNGATIYPCGQTADITAVEDDMVTESDMDWPDIIPNTGVPGDQQNQLRATPDAGGDLHFLFPATLCLTVGTFIEIEGELDGVFWTATGNGEISEDRLLIGDDRYYLFQCGNRDLPFSYQAIRQG